MKKKLSVLLVLVLAVAISAYSVGGTYAKYTTTANISGSAAVAKWAIAMKSDSTELSSLTSFDLISTRKDTKDDAAETDVAASKIAPGTYGSFNLELDGTGTEVAYTYAITFTAENIPTNLKFYRDAAMTNEITATAGVYTVADGTVNLADAKVSDNTVYWKWAYDTVDDDTTDTINEAEVYDAADLVNGVAGNTMTINATLTATQVD